MGVWYGTCFISIPREAWHLLILKYINQQEFYEVWCRPSFSTRMWNHWWGNRRIRLHFLHPWSMTWRSLSAPFHVHPFIRLYTINYIPLLFLSVSPRLMWFMEWAGILTDQPPHSPVFMSQSQQKGCRTHRFHSSRTSCVHSGVRGAFRGEGSRLRCCTSASYSLP